MSVKYSLTEKGNPLKPTDPRKWYANSKSVGTITLKALGKEISQRTSMKHSETMVVLKTLTQVLSEQLADGNIVRLSNFGSFQVSIGSEGVETPAKFNTNLIKTRKVTFRSGRDIREMLEKLQFEKR